MPKMKTHKGIAKRVKISARGKVKRHRAGAGHLMSTKSGSRCRGLRKTADVHAPIARKYRILLGK